MFPLFPATYLAKEQIQNFGYGGLMICFSPNRVKLSCWSLCSVGLGLQRLLSTWRKTPTLMKIEGTIKCWFILNSRTFCRGVQYNTRLLRLQSATRRCLCWLRGSIYLLARMSTGALLTFRLYVCYLAFRPLVCVFLSLVPPFSLHLFLSFAPSLSLSPPLSLFPVWLLAY